MIKVLLVDVFLFCLFAYGLYASRRTIQVRLQGLVMLMGGSRFNGVMLYALIFLPGIIIHELSHFFAAAMLGVRTGDIALFPKKIDGDDNRVALGSVKVAKTDFVRGSLIGAAPFFVGTVTIFSLVKIFFLPEVLTLHDLTGPSILHLLMIVTEPGLNWMWLLLLFVVGNTMFSSKEDTGAFPVLAVMLVLAMPVFIYAQQRGWLKYIPVESLILWVRSLHVSFLLVILINWLVAGILYGLERLMGRAMGKRVVYRS